MLSRDAQEWADEIRNHDWSDAPYRTDRAGHQRDHDGRNRTERVLTASETGAVRLNVIFVASQILSFRDPNFDVLEFARAAGDANVTKSALLSGLRWRDAGVLAEPGVWPVR